MITIEASRQFRRWRQTTRQLVLGGHTPETVHWQSEGQPTLFSGGLNLTAAGSGRQLRVNKRFVTLARTCLCFRDSSVFPYLYRLLWRLTNDNPRLLEIATDNDVHRLQAMAKTVRRDNHKMRAFVRFRQVDTEQGERFVAWFEPDHLIVRYAASFFSKRFANMRFSILTPDACMHHDHGKVEFSAGVPRAMAPVADDVEDLWRQYYGNIFNPARIKLNAMRAEMPKKYWHNLPESRLIPQLVSAAEKRVESMQRDTASAPSWASTAARSDGIVHAPGNNSGFRQIPDLQDLNLDQMSQYIDQCRACPLWEAATQPVFGAGPTDASLMLVGEQPGDSEDLKGNPFVGPAGQLLDQALTEAGTDRAQTYITNAVKHFKYTMRGKRRIHAKPSVAQIKACQPWLVGELRRVRPQVVVALGASATRSLTGKALKITDVRGEPFKLPIADDHQVQLLVTVHPSHLLRLPPIERDDGFRRFVKDLRQAAQLAGLQSG